MTGPTFTVEGASRLERTMRAAGRKVGAMSAANRAFGQAVIGAADPPRLTGRLAGSLRAEGDDTGVTVSSGLPYAGVIENGWRRHNIEPTHFLADAARRSATNLRPYETHIDNALAGVKGA